MQSTVRLEQFSKLRALVIGDIMLDRFVYGSIERISPESPAPLLTMKEARAMLGGAGNVVRNLSALGATVTLHTVIGDDAIGREILTLVGKEPRVVANVITEQGRPSTIKARYVTDGQQLLRVDHETKREIAQSSNRRMLESLRGEFASHNVVILSDYKKGVLSAELTRQIINAAGEHHKPVIVDPKDRSLEHYRGATVLTPNLAELRKIALLSGCPVVDIDTDEDIIEAAFWLASTFDIAHMLVTRGKDGMTLASNGGGYCHLPARAHQVSDVSGAGDTVVSVLALALATGAGAEDAARLANTAAGIAVERIGTSTVSQLDLQLARISERRVGGIHKIMTLDNARDLVGKWKRDGRCVGFANGCFDLIHTGHLNLISGAREQCDRLIVAINSNASVARLKGEQRPIQDQHERAMILASMEAVDLVIIYEDDTPQIPVERLLPDKMFKGSDYQFDTIVGAQAVRDAGGEVIILPRTEVASTTDMIRKAGKVPLACVVNNQQGAQA